jgi:hypothetical protein
MSISYELAPNPKWYIADLVGRPLGGGSMFTYRSLNKTQRKFVFQDPAGVFPWPDPVLFDENGTQGPLYFKVDTDNPDETYYIEVYDSDGVLQWTIDNFLPSGGGGGSIITTAISLDNLIINNVFWRNIGATSNPITDTLLTLAPGPHAGLAETDSNGGPNILFIKNNTNATDQISFLPFILGDTPLTGDVTPVDYLNYACTNTPSSETIKCIQFPITRSTQNLSNQDVAVTIWARGNSGTTTLTLQWRQFFGDGPGASPDVITLIDTINLNSSWVKYGPFQVTIPNVSTKVIGGCGNDALFLQVQYPLGASCNIDFTKPSVFLGNIAAEQDYQTYDMIDGVINTPRTGDIRTSLNSFSPFGWVPMNNGTIGDESSNATTRANIDTFPLYNLIWEMMQDNQVYAPMYTLAGIPISYTDPITDFTAHNQISLTKSLGLVLAGTTNDFHTSQTYTADSTTDLLTMSDTIIYGTGTPVRISNSGGAAPGGLIAGNIYYTILISATTLKLATTIDNAITNVPIDITSNGTGTNSMQEVVTPVGIQTGEAQHTLTIPEIPSHSHDSFRDDIGDIGLVASLATNQGAEQKTLSGQIGNTGGGGAHNNLQPTVFMNVFMKL